MSNSTPMSSAPFVWRADGRPDWGRMWTTFCELALYGGPPQRGPESALRAPTGPAPDGDGAMLAEMRRGIWETTGLYAESTAPGRLTVTCGSPAMAEWMGAAIVVENVEARVEEDRVIAKTHHYWQAHLTGAGG